jgi:hypothetical protein
VCEGVSTAVRVILGVALGAAAVSAASRLAATRSRNAALTPIRYTAPFRWSVSAEIAGDLSTSRGIMNLPFAMVARLQKGS